MEHTMPKLTSLHVSLPEDLKEFVREEVAKGGYRYSGVTSSAGVSRLASRAVKAFTQPS
jgi:Arc/MetJ-type ribon-helix-helix transcriptional regulator